MSGMTAWTRLLGADPVPGLLACAEPAARWVVRTAVLGQASCHPEVAADRAAALADAGTEALIGRLPDWTAGNKLSGHNDPRFAPNLLNLLAEMGVTEADDPRIGRLLDEFLAHQDRDGRFLSFGSARASDEPVWGALPCDTHAVTEVLVRYGRAGDPGVRRALARIADDLTATAQGRAWPCRPHTVTGFRGPGRKGDFCPQVTLQALRVFAALPAAARPDGLDDTARVALRAWQMRGMEKPYMFGHGIAFKTVKWPVTWYGATPCSTPSDATPGCGANQTATQPTGRRWPNWPRAWWPTTPGRTAGWCPARCTAASSPTRSGRRNARRRLPPRDCSRYCIGSTI